MILLLLSANAPGSLVPWLVVALIVFTVVTRPRLRARFATPVAGQFEPAAAAPIASEHDGRFELDGDGLPTIDPTSLAPMDAPPPTIAAIPSPKKSLIAAMRALSRVSDIPDPAHERPPLVVTATERLIERVLVERGFDRESPRFHAAASACRLALLYSADERRVERN